MIEGKTREKILENAISLAAYGINDLAWERDDALHLLNSLLNDNVGVLGGDVYILKSNTLTPTYDNWYINEKSGENLTEFYLRSKIEARLYIESYPKNDLKNHVFSMVFNEVVLPYNRIEADVSTINNNDPIAYQIHRYSTGFLSLNALLSGLQGVLNDVNAVDDKWKTEFQELLVILEVLCSLSTNENSDSDDLDRSNEIFSILKKLMNLRPLK
jgi:hypothetical protein